MRQIVGGTRQPTGFNSVSVILDEQHHYRLLASRVPERARECSVSILVKRGTGLAQQGTATIVALGSDYFLVTAAHVVRTANVSNLPLFIATPKDTFVPLTGTWSLTGDSGPSRIVDVAGMMLDDRTKSEFEEQYVLRLSDVSFEFNEEFAVYCVFGWPAIWTTKKSTDSRILNTRAVQFVTHAYEGSTLPLENFDHRYHLALDASLDDTCDENAEPAAFSYDRGLSARFPGDLGGISGCSVWYMGDRRLPLDQWENLIPKVVGLETSVYHEKGVMRATRWNAIGTMLYDRYPQTRSILHLHGISK